jgi:hypothetical protein
MSSIVNSLVRDNSRSRARPSSPAWRSAGGGLFPSLSCAVHRRAGQPNSSEAEKQASARSQGDCQTCVGQIVTACVVTLSTAIGANVQDVNWVYGITRGRAQSILLPGERIVYAPPSADQEVQLCA